MGKKDLNLSDLTDREIYRPGYGMGRRGYEINQTYFQEHEKKMNQLVCKFLLLVFFIIPVMMIVHFAGIVLFSTTAMVVLGIVGSVSTLSPYLLSKMIKNQMALKYYTFFCGIIFVAFLVTTYRIGISIAFFLPTFVSCIYFNPTFTVTMTTVSYVAYVFSYFLRYAVFYREGFANGYMLAADIPSMIGFTVEFVISALLFYAITIQSRSLFVNQQIMIAELEKSREKMRMAMGAATDILFEYDIEKDLYTSNRTVRGWREKEIEIPDFSEYIRHMKWENEDFLNLFQSVIHLPTEKGDHFQEEICINFEENDIKYPAWANFEINILRNDEGKPVTVLGKLRDITQIKLEELKRKEEKHVDTLTGMYTYDSFKRLIEELYGQEKDSVHQIMVIHLKNYQEIAECYGEVYRDFVLINVSDYIKKKIESLDILTCRLASDVFLLYINDGEHTDGRILRQELNQGLHELYIGEKEVRTLEYDFGYYSGKEQIDDLLQVAFEYIDEEPVLDKAGSYQLHDDKVEAFVGEERLYDLPGYQRSDAVTKFNNNISSLILGAKDQQSTIQIILDRIGKFFGLDSIRVYEIPEQRHSVMPAYLWTKEEYIKKEFALMLFSAEEQKTFAENFGKSRIVDGTVGAFHDFFKEFGETPLSAAGYSSLICPLSTSDICQGILIFDLRKTDYQWSDEQKEHLLSVCKILGNYILVALNNDSVKQQRIFLTTMSKMLRMPMNSIFELTDIARKSVDNPTELIQYMDMIDVSSENMLHVVNNIIDLSKFNIDSMLLNEGVFSLEDMLSKVEDKMLPLARSRHVSFLIERRFGDNLLHGDRGRIEQVLLSLVENAIYYTEPKGRVHLRITELSKENRVVDMSFEVENTGSGIPKQVLPHIFDTFADKKTDRTEKEIGTEMDLGVCWQLVHIMGSELTVESEKGKGTKFSFALKLGQSPNENMLVFLTQKKREEMSKVELKDKRILIAEDDKINGEILKRLFEKNGARVELAENGKRCLEIFKKSSVGEYAFILMDISMPVMNGHETTKEIRKLKREDAKKIPILALSANAFQEDIRMSMTAGMNAHLTKPVHMDKIMEELVKVQSERES